MNKTVRLSLLYLLLIIPQHGNVPIPRMESWMEMDQGDGFVDRDLTSSLTGAESFGSAHKDYQNALIRKKQADNEDEEPTDNFSGIYPDRVQRSPLPANLMQNPNFGYNNYMTGYNRNQRDGLLQSTHQDYRMKLSKNDKSTLLGQRYSGILNAKDVRRRDSKASSFGPRMSKCSRSFYHPEPALMELLKYRDSDNGKELVDNNEFVYGNEGMLNPVKSRLNEDEIRLDELDVPEQRLMRYNRDEEDPNAEESEYYNEERNPAFVRGDIPDVADVDYSQINPHGVLYKREEHKGSNSKSSVKGEQVDRGSIGADNKENSLEETRSDNTLEAVAPKEGHEIAKSNSKAISQKSDAAWKMSSNLRTKELSDVMKDSQRVLEEVQMFQQKLAVKPQYNYANVDWKTDTSLKGKKTSYDEEEDRRNKREDEDEQKNMKTGSDEGGGEYEDEEGKGHHDDEEYYEEAELSGGKTRPELDRMDGNANRKLYKRDATKDVGRESRNEGKDGTEEKVTDYELTLENAPVEHEEKSKKSSQREGMSGKRVVARKGAKIWDHWGKWSPCSVTCGVGRTTRWRHCIGGGCAQGEKEAVIKKCTNPAC